MQKNQGFVKFVFFLIVLIIVAGIFYYLGGRKLPKTLPESVTAPAVTQKSGENLATYSNLVYKFSFEYPKNISFKKDFYLASEKETKSFKAGTEISVGIESAADLGVENNLLDLSIPVLDFSLSVLQKPASFKNLSEFVSDEIETAKDAGTDSAAGVFVSDANPEIINGNTVIIFTIQDGSAAGNTTAMYYFEKNNYIYVISYFYSRTNFETGYGDHDAKADEVKKVEEAQKIIASFKFTK